MQTEAPVVEAPVVEARAVQAPAVQAPMAEAICLPDRQRAAALDQLANLWRAGDLLPNEAAAAASASCQPTGFEALDAELPGHGWPTGQLIELLFDSPGIGELGLLVPALAQVALRRRSCVWVLPSERPGLAAGSPSIPYPPALAASGIDLARSLFVRPAVPRESFWALEQALRASHLGAVIGWVAAGVPDGDFRALRRLQLLAARHRVLVFVLRELACAQAPSPAALRLQLAAIDGRLQVTILKRRGRPMLNPIVLQLQPQHGNPRGPLQVHQTPAIEPTAPAAGQAHVPPALPARRWSLASIFSH
jgi:protein ImuA